MLESLSGEDARSLVDALPERDTLDEKVAQAILEAAEGVPLFLEQLAAHAAESGLADDRIPPTLDALLASRIDALEPGERAVLSRAAIVGRSFSRESIGALTPDVETRELDGRLASLERRRLVRPRGWSTSSSTRSSTAPRTTRSVGRRGRRCTNASRAGSTRAVKATSSSARTWSAQRAIPAPEASATALVPRRVGPARSRGPAGASGVRPLSRSEPAGARGCAPRRRRCRAARAGVQSRPRAEGAGRARPCSRAFSKGSGDEARATGNRRIEARARVESILPRLGRWLSGRRQPP